MTVPAHAASPASPPTGRDGAANFGAAIKALLLAQLHRIESGLGERRRPHGAIHEVRKAVRRFRSVLALCVDVATDEFTAFDRRVRRIGKRLSTLRDAHVRVATTSAVRRGDRRDEIWHALDLWLRRERKQLLARALADDPDFAALRRRARRVARDLDAIDFGRLDGHAILRALHASAARMAKAEQKANAHPCAAVRHRWRRRVRRLRLQLEGLTAVAEDSQLPAAIRVEAQRVLTEALDAMPSAATLAVLADRLGERQDVINLAATVRRHHELPFRDEILAALKPLE